jgi:hypothetical protein
MLTPLHISIAGLVLQLLWIVYWFGVFNGGFKEFKETVTKKLERLEGVFFKDVKVMPHEDTAEGREKARRQAGWTQG